LLRKSENLKDIMPIVLEGCKKAEESGLDIEGISSREYDYLQTIPDAVENEIGKLNQFISSVLKTLSKTVKGEISREDLEICWIHGIIGRALIEYPYADDEERSLIEYKRGANFTFLGNDILLIYAFYNLIKNSLYQIEKNKKGKIYITTEIDEETNVVRFKDTAGGASPEIIKQFFSGYKTNKHEGTGLGLASIKQTMQLFGGDVACNSEEGDFIEFIFSFPKLQS
jgi:signal transduction histidine kinase